MREVEQTFLSASLFPLVHIQSAMMTTVSLIILDIKCKTVYRCTFNTEEEETAFVLMTINRWYQGNLQIPTFSLKVDNKTQMRISMPAQHISTEKQHYSPEIGGFF